MVYGEDGARIVFPWSVQVDSSSTDRDDSSGIDIIVDDGKDIDLSDLEADDIPVLDEDGSYLLELSLEDLLSGSGTALIEAVYGTGAVVKLKDVDGVLHWASQVSSPPGMDSSYLAEDAADPTAIAQAVARLQQAGYTVTAAIECARDDLLAQERSYAIRQRSGGNSSVIWIDSNGDSWANLGQSDVENYYCALCQELAAMGFDELLLLSVCYPTTATASDNLTNSTYLSSTEARQEVINGFVDAITAAVSIPQRLPVHDSSETGSSDEDITDSPDTDSSWIAPTVSLWLETGTLTAEETDNGQNAISFLSSHAARLWVSGSDTNAQLSAAADAGASSNRLMFCFSGKDAFQSGLHLESLLTEGF